MRDVNGHGWSKDGRRLIRRGGEFSGDQIGWWEVRRPAPSYVLETAVTSLSLNRDGSRLAVNDMVCTVVQQEYGQELVSWNTPAKGLTPQFVGKDEVWGVGTREATVQAPWIQTELWRLAPERRMWVVPEPPCPEAQKEADKWNGILATIDAPPRPQVGGASIVGLLGSPSGQGPLFAASALFPGRIETYHVLVRTERWAMAPEGHRFFRKVGFSTERFSWSGGHGRAGMPGQFPVLELWDYQEMKRLASSNEFADCIQFSPDGRRVATDTEAGSGLKIWDAATGKVEKVLPSDGSQALVFSGDGRRLLAVKVGATARLFDVDTGQKLRAWKAGKEDWQAFALNPDGTLVASGGEDKMIHIWEVATGREVARWQGHDGGVTALLFSRDGQALYSGSNDGTLKLWDLPAIRKELATLGLDW